MFWKFFYKDDIQPEIQVPLLPLPRGNHTLIVSLHLLYHIKEYRVLCQKSLSYVVIVINSVMMEGISHWKVVRGCAAVMTPYFQVSRHFLACQFTINVPLMCSHFLFLEKKNCIFSLVLAKNSALKVQIFKIFISQDPSFFKENLLPRPYFWKTVAHIHQKKSWVHPRQLIFFFNRSRQMPLMFDLWYLLPWILTFDT